jgi:arylsulfatase A-like enzyme
MVANGPHVAMRQGDWKIVAPQDLSRFELYHLKQDPNETTDLREQEPARFEAMRKELTALNASIEAEGPDWWKRLSPGGGTARP